MRLARLLAATVLAGAGLVAVGATSQSAHAAGSLNLSVPYTSVVKLEILYGTGTLPSASVRPVKLQYRNTVNDPWLTLKVTESASNGDFSFIFNTGKTRYFRYYAPAHNGQASIKGNQRKLTVVAQKVQFFAVSVYCTAAGHNLVTYMADFYPARPGRAVGFQTTAGTRYDDQDAQGVASVVLDTGSAPITGATSFAKADALNGIPEFSSGTYSYQASSCSPA